MATLSTARCIEFTVILQRKGRGWVQISAIIHCENTQEKLHFILDHIDPHDERFEVVKNVSRTQLNEWLADGRLSKVMEINKGEYRGHQIGYFHDLRTQGDNVELSREHDRQLYCALKYTSGTATLLELLDAVYPCV